MPRIVVPTRPNTETLLMLLREYQRMLVDARRAAKRVLAQNPQSEKFWDELSESASFFTLVGDRSNSIWEEIVDLIDQLPED